MPDSRPPANLRQPPGDAAQLNVILSELIGLIRDGTVPQNACTYTAPQFDRSSAVEGSRDRDEMAWIAAQAAP